MKLFTFEFVNKSPPYGVLSISYGSVAEWFKASISKVEEGNTSRSSNLLASSE
jgi:hypothetical protein